MPRSFELTIPLGNIISWIKTLNCIFACHERITSANTKNQQRHSSEWNVKDLKQSRNRPGVAQRVPGGLGSQILWHSTREGGDVVRLTHRPPLPPGMFLVLIFTRGWVDPRAMVQSEGNTSLKNPVTPPGIDPGTVRLLEQRLNHYATLGGPILCGVNMYK